MAHTLTIADLALAMNVSFGKEEGLSLDAFPNVTRWHGLLSSRPAYRKVNG